VVGNRFESGRFGRVGVLAGLKQGDGCVLLAGLYDDWFWPGLSRAGAGIFPAGLEFWPGLSRAGAGIFPAGLIGTVGFSG
jgi:hypothetical protein